jgi:cytochrome c
MKRTLFLISTSVIFFPLFSLAQTHTKKAVTPRKTVTKTTTTAPVAPAVKKPTEVELAEGKDLLAKSDCLTCHKVDIKIVGPAYIDVAKKYPASEANYELLVKKVIAGGGGNWGTNVMAPHATLAPADAKKMVEYILSLK